jgi:hypothetical protein
VAGGLLRGIGREAHAIFLRLDLCRATDLHSGTSCMSMPYFSPNPAQRD